MKWAMMAASAAVVVAGCATTVRAGADFDPGVDFSRYRTFTWDETDETDWPAMDDPRLQSNPFFNQRMHAAILWELSTRGIRESKESTGLTVHHHFTVRDRMEVFEADRDTGFIETEYGDGTEVVQYEEGTFLVDIADAGTRKILWRGWAQMDVGAALRDREVMRQRIDQALSKMFERFPIAPALGRRG